MRAAGGLRKSWAACKLSTYNLAALRDSWGALVIRNDKVEVPHTSVSVYEAIYQRRMAKEFMAEVVRDEVLSRLFDAAIWAPNHRLTEPTRFFVLKKDSAARTKVSDLAWETAYQKVVNPNPEQKRRSGDASRNRVLSAPALVYVYSVPGPSEEVTQENYATACCAVQNMALSAVAEGLCLDWSTGRRDSAPGPGRYARRRP